ncbi:MAG: hypothetical protein QF879_06315 [Candidatus Latescibacteria bacterium]|nr:hypothetical protein [Candidatus Latescibacterota bacterium]
MISQDEYFTGVTLIRVLLAIVLLIFLNPSWTEVGGYSITETPGTHINLYVYPDGRLPH